MLLGYAIGKNYICIHKSLGGIIYDKAFKGNRIRYFLY